VSHDRYAAYGGRLKSWNVDLDLRQFGVAEKRTAADVCPIGDHDTEYCGSTALAAWDSEAGAIGPGTLSPD
jgi:hypothetical protein